MGIRSHLILRSRIRIHWLEGEPLNAWNYQMQKKVQGQDVVEFIEPNEV